MLCTDTRDLLDDARQTFKDNHQITGEIPADMCEKWREYAGHQNWPGNSDRYRTTIIGTIADVIPKPRENKATIMYWLGYWPLSMLWFFFHDVIERIIQRIYRHFITMYERIARNTFAGIQDDFGEDDK